MGTNRLESFSDGVIAVAITLLVLGITVPVPVRGPHPPSLAHDLGRLWPDYAAYATSFLTIGIIWINHHAMISRLRQADHAILILNILLLMSIGILPFATQVMANYLRQPRGQALAAAVYSGSFLLMSLTFVALNRQILLVKPDLMVQRLPLAIRRRIFARGLTGLIPYALATALAPVSPYLTLAICAAVGLFYARPVAAGVEPGRSSG